MNTNELESVYPHDLAIGDVVGDFGFLPVTDIMVDGPSAYEVRLHGPAEYWITVGATGMASQTYSVPSDQMVTRLP